ncbi:MAG: hypothetical protein JWO36_5976 [Myxococcales bacterium]|nr:hypothetical protein [Myxococcales bacterium]
MRLGGEHRLIPVTAHARDDFACAKLVRLMALRALLVSVRERVVADPKCTAWLARVASRASLVGGELGLVDLMTIDAAARPCVLRLLLCMTLRARLRIEGRRLVCAMAIAARLFGVCPDCMHGALRTSVTMETG